MTIQPAQAADLSALSGMAPQLAATLASVAGDIALVIDTSGVIRNVAMGREPISTADGWVGRAWADTVTGETRRKIQMLLDEVGERGVTQRRQVNIPGRAGPDIPISFAAIRLGSGGPVLAVGRDLRAIAAIQQRFVESQQDMERDYWKRRQADDRYRQLFQVATDAVLVVDALSLGIVEANQASAALLGHAPDQLVGRHATGSLEPHSRAAVDELFATTRTTGRAAEIRARLDGGTGVVDISATPFRSADALLLLVRARAVDVQPVSPEAGTRLADFVERTPDAVVITDSAGRVNIANPAFVALCEAESEGGCIGRSLGEFFGAPGRDLASVLAEVRRHGIAPRVAARFVGTRGAAVEVEISAAMLTEGDQECLGFTLRRMPVRDAAALPLADALANVLDDLAAQLGRVDLPMLMREATRLAERHLIDAALVQCGRQTRTAAAVLGIAPESLLLRMRRLGLTEGGDGAPPRLLN